MTTKTLPDSTTASYYYSGSSVTLVNAGIQGKPGASGINFGFVVTGNNDTLINNGTVYGQRVGVYVKGSGDSVTNAVGKQITATEPVQAGVNFYDYSGTITNYGTISGYANAVNGAGGNAVQLRHGGIVTNFGTLLNGGLLVRSALGTVINSGVILGNSAYGGVYMNTGGQVTNLSGGLISANGATASYKGAPPYGVYINGGAGTVTNAGTINGSTGYAVELATGFRNQVIVDPGAVFIGTVDGGTSADATLVLASAASAGTLTTTNFTNFGTIDFDTGSKWTLVGSASALAGVITGFSANDTIDLTGFTAVSATYAGGNLTLTNAIHTHTTLHFSGGPFNDATPGLTSNAEGTVLTESLASAALIYGETIDETGFVAATETVTAGVMTLENAGGSAVGSITVGTSLSTGDFTLATGGTITGTDVIVDTVFGTYTSGVTLLVNPTTIASTARITGSGGSAIGVTGPAGTAWTLVNQGSISETGGSSYGVRLAADGTISNASGATISGGQAGIMLAASGLLTNSGTITATGAVAVSAASGLVLTNASGGVISGYSVGVQAASATIINHGTIRGTGTHASAVYLNGGGNDGTIGNYGLLTATYIGVQFRGAATLGNSGTIISNGRYGVRFDSAGSVTNSGTIVGISALEILGSGTVNNIGLILGLNALAIVGTGSLVNSGTIDAVYGTGVVLGSGSISNTATGVITAFYTGVTVTSGAATVTNAGTIIGNTGVVFYSAGIASQTLIDSGTIEGTGGTAVAFGASNDLLKLQPGNLRIQGIVNGGGGTNTLEFASGATAGTLTGVGLAFTNFSQGTVDAGANWVLAGSNTFGSGVTVTETGTLTDSGTLTNAGTFIGATYGARLIASALLTNTSGGRITGSYSTAGAGVYLEGGGSVTNQSGATIGGLRGVYSSKGAVVTVVNAGAILGNPTASAGAGVYLSVGGSVSNQSGGTITGNAGIVFGPTSNGTVIDSGTIIGTGGTAVSFGNGTNLMLLQPGNLRIQGGVLGGAGTSTLEFASGASTGTLTGVEAAFSGFSQGTVDAGAQWVLAGGNTFAGTPLTDAGTLSNIGSLVVGPQLGVTGTFLNTGSVVGGGSVAISVASGGVLGNSGAGAITGATGNYASEANGGAGGTGVYMSGGAATNAAAIAGGVGGGGGQAGE
jgi:hypothetical protein